MRCTTRTNLGQCLVAAWLLSAGPAGLADEKPAKKEDASVWMTKKLEYSRKVLEGLVKGDFEAVRKNAGAMQVVGYLEEWDRGKNPEYRRQMTYFQDANKELIRQAGRKNLNGATLAYTQLTLSCVQCHNVVRDAKRK